MAGEHEMAGDFFPKARLFRKFTGGGAGFDRFAAGFVGEDPFAIEPVLHLFTRHDEL